MKKNLLSLVMVVGLSGLANAGTFTGGYVGASVGTEARGTQYNFRDSAGNAQFNKNKVGPLLALFGGYGRVIGACFYLGGEFGVSGPIKIKRSGWSINLHQLHSL